MKRLSRVRWGLTVCAVGVAVSLAVPVAAAERSGVETPRGFQEDYLRELDSVAGKLTALAAEIPAERYGWRPTAEVRSVSEVLVHVAWTNEALLAAIAGESPPRPRAIDETMASKPDVMAYLESSIAEVRQRVEALAADELEEEIQLFGGPRTARFVLLRLLNHTHEHLGQLIVYARLLEIAPPWSR